jgi:hypothetical protein
MSTWSWFFLLLGLLAWHAVMTLQLFGQGDAWSRLTDDQIVISGRHPVHLYHGWLGSQAFRFTYRFSCYDPAFDAGYPKTPIFDGGARPAELFLTLAGSRCDPAAYKIGLAVCCLLVPAFLLLASWGAGFPLSVSTLATAAGLLVWWGSPCRRALELGEIDLILAALAVLAHVGLLIRFDREPSFLAWQGLFLTACIGWFVHPILFPILLPLLLVYYLSVGPRHSLSTWHLGLGVAELGAVAVNFPWLIDWFHHWSLRSPLPPSDAILLHRTMATVWLSPQWGDHADRILAAIVLISAVLGLACLNQQHQRPSARLLGLGALSLWLLAILGVTWEPMARLCTADLLAAGLWFAALPAAYAWAQLFSLAATVTGSRVWATAVTTAILGTVGVLQSDLVEAWANRYSQPSHLVLGLGPNRLALADALKKHTTREARILWEDRRPTGGSSRWSALLPLLTDRLFVGGLDSTGAIENAGIGLIDQSLHGKLLAQWSPDDLTDYCRRYNIAWIACRPESAEHFRAWDGVTEIAQLYDDSPIYLFALKQPAMSFALKGSCTVVSMDHRSIILRDVVPNKDGYVVLSFHYQTGLQTMPARAIIQREQDAGDLVPFIRLRVDRTVPRLTITWRGW